MIDVLSKPGDGSTFIIFLPVASSDAVKPARRPRTDENWKGSGTVLLADDEEIVLITLKRMLEKMGFDVIETRSGKEALQTYKDLKEKITFAILDLTMPDMSGVETFREIKKISPAMKVFISSGYSESELSREFAGEQPPGFLQKPYSYSRLVELIKEGLTQGRSSRS